MPKTKEILDHVMYEYHDKITSGHFGFLKTYSNISKKYYWNGMKRYILTYINRCDICQKNKSSTSKGGGRMFAHEIPNQKWEIISIDFITNLPPTKENNFNSIFVIVDKLSKMAHFIPHHTTDNAPKIAELFISNIFKLHGLPKTIISDRDTRFTSKFWNELCKRLDIKLNKSTAYHPQTNGQVERINRILEDYIRRYCNCENDNWDKLLALAEFAYNNSISASTKYSPFYLNYGIDPKFSLNEIYNSTNNETVEDFVQKMNTILQESKDNLKESIESQEKFYNKNKINTEFKVGDQVLLSTRNLNYKNNKGEKMNKIFKPKFIGPFKVLEKFSKLAYKIELPRNLKIHTVFHVSILKKFLGNSKNVDDLKDVIEEPTEYNIEKIIGKRIKDGQVYYLVSYDSVDTHEDEWINAHELKNYKKLIDDFENADFWVENSPKRREDVIF